MTLTSGHHNIALRGLKLCDLLVIGIHMESSSKSYMFSNRKKDEMFLSYFNEAERQNMRVDLYEGLTAEYASKIEALGLLRGLRTNADFEFEFQMAAMNKHLKSSIRNGIYSNRRWVGTCIFFSSKRRFKVS